MARRRQKQLELVLKTHGGARRGAGRKPNGKKAMVSRLRRPVLTGREPLHVTLRLAPGLPRLRNKKTYKLIRRCFADAKVGNSGVRLVDYNIQNNHLHLICEAKNKEGLSRGMQGLKVRLARRLNGLWGRMGTVFADRYHAVILSTPRQVRNALKYVLHNHKNHAKDAKRPVPKGADFFSSALTFKGWRYRPKTDPPDDDYDATHAPSVWLLSRGWRKRGLIAP